MTITSPWRHGGLLGSQDSDPHRKRGRDDFRICRYTTRPGRFRIRGKLTAYTAEDGTILTPPAEPTVRWIEPARFRWRRP